MRDLLLFTVEMRDLLLFTVLALEAHFFVGATQWPTPAPHLSLATCAILVFCFKPHFVTIFAVAVPSFVMLRVCSLHRYAVPLHLLGRAP